MATSYIDNFERQLLSVDSYVRTKFVNTSNVTPVVVQRLYEKLQSKGKSLLENLQYSVLEGEYIVDQGLEDRLSVQKNRVAKVLKKLVLDPVVYENAETLFCNPLVVALDNYRYLVHRCNTHITDPDKVFLIAEFGDENKGKASPTDVINLQDYGKIFFYNLLLADIDMTFSLDSQCLQRLFLLLKRLQDSKCSDEKYVLYLIDKCKLLIYKFRLKYADDEIFKSMWVSFDFEDKEIDPDALELKYLAEVKRQIAQAYPLKAGNNSYYLRDYVRGKKHAPKSRLDYFWFVEHYRENKRSEKDIDDLIASFEETKNVNDSRFDERSYDTCLNYLYNNRLSLACNRIVAHAKEDFVGDLEKLENEQKRIVELQERTDIKNYFPYMKLANCYSRYLDMLYKKDIGTIGMDITSQYLDGLQRCTKLMRKYLDWGERYGFLPFQPSYNECRIECPGESPKSLFIYSSCIIPVDYKKEYERLTQLEADCQRHKITLSVHQSLQSDRKKIEIAQKDAKDSQKNNIQILAIFATLVVFVMGSIQLFREFTSPASAIQFMLALAFSLCLFSLTIWLIVNDHKIWRWLIGLTILISAVVNICVLLAPPSNISPRPQEVPTVGVPVDTLVRQFE